MQYVEIDMKNFRAFLDKIDRAGKSGFKQECGKFLEGVGMEFLRIVEDEIIRMKVVDTRLLLTSFHKGGPEGVWELNEGDLTLEVGTNVKYAQWVNDGHHQTPGRYIPGEWHGSRFVYMPEADTGMVLKAEWVEGKHFMETSVRALERMFPRFMEAKMKEWLESYFGMS